MCFNKEQLPLLQSIVMLKCHLSLIRSNMKVTPFPLERESQVALDISEYFALYYDKGLSAGAQVIFFLFWYVMLCVVLYY